MGECSGIRLEHPLVGADQHRRPRQRPEQRGALRPRLGGRVAQAQRHAAHHVRAQPVEPPHRLAREPGGAGLALEGEDEAAAVRGPVQRRGLVPEAQPVQRLDRRAAGDGGGKIGLVDEERVPHPVEPPRARGKEARLDEVAQGPLGPPGGVEAGARRAAGGGAVHDQAAAGEPGRGTDRGKDVRPALGLERRVIDQVKDRLGLS